MCAHLAVSLIVLASSFGFMLTKNPEYFSKRNPMIIILETINVEIHLDVIASIIGEGKHCALSCPNCACS